MRIGERRAKRNATPYSSGLKSHRSGKRRTRKRAETEPFKCAVQQRPEGAAPSNHFVHDLRGAVAVMTRRGDLLGC